MNPTVAALWSEGVLSLYPILIKSIHTNLFSQLLARFAVFPILALVFGSLGDVGALWKNPLETVLNGLLNLGHVGASYLSFSLLPAGSALALFYTYPLFNLLAGAILFGETITPLSLLFMAMAFCGVYLIATQRSSSSKPSHPVPSDTDPHTWGVVMGLLAALTETMFFVFVRSSPTAASSPFYTIQSLYWVGLLGLLYIAFRKPAEVETSPRQWGSLLGFNAVLGFTGYLSRFYAIPKLSTAAFSLLSFMGVAFGYLWGILFTGDHPSLGSLAGGLLIALSISLFRWTSSGGKKLKRMNR
jgi:drug/metabolite transporter (DMT)-like permease